MEIGSDHFLQERDLKDWMNFRVVRKLQFVRQWHNKFKELIGAIKLGRKLLVVILFERGSVIRP
jgi:hypothetical protein